VKKTTRFVIWICSKFTRREIEQIIQGLIEILANRNPEVKPKDDFKEKHSNYCNFFVDPEPLLKASPQKAPKLNWKELLSNYQKEKCHPLLPINTKDPESKVPKGSRLYLGFKISAINCKRLIKGLTTGPNNNLSTLLTIYFPYLVFKEHIELNLLLRYIIWSRDYILLVGR